MRLTLDQKITKFFPITRRPKERELSIDTETDNLNDLCDKRYGKLPLTELAKPAPYKSAELTVAKPTNTTITSRPTVVGSSSEYGCSDNGFDTVKSYKNTDIWKKAGVG
jgi:hypothetical protein